MKPSQWIIFAMASGWYIVYSADGKYMYVLTFFLGPWDLPPATSKEDTLASCPESVLTGLKSRADQICKMQRTR